LFQHSRFLYPPQVAVLLRPLAGLPYAVAKRLWMGICLASVAAALALTGRLYGLRRKWGHILLVAIFAILYYPLLTHLERGQVDALTLLLLVGAGVGLAKRTPRGEWSAGALLCAATLLKLHCVYMLPFLAIRKKGRALLGYLACGAAIAALTAVTPGGIAASLGYARDEMPRIARYGEWGTDEMRVPQEYLDRQLQGLPQGSTAKDGVVYRRESFRFFANGTLVRVIQRTIQQADLWVSQSLVSALVLGVLFVVMLGWQLWLPERLHARNPERGLVWVAHPWQLDARAEFLYWQIVAGIVLLAAPLTWVMNLVWLLPQAVVVLAELGRAGKGRGQGALVGAALALLIIALPDGVGAPWVAGELGELIADKYVIGTGLLLVSMLGYLTSSIVQYKVKECSHAQRGLFVIL
jgi:hypothetical protein